MNCNAPAQILDYFLMETFPIEILEEICSYHPTIDLELSRCCRHTNKIKVKLKIKREKMFCGNFAVNSTFVYDMGKNIYVPIIERLHSFDGEPSIIFKTLSDNFTIKIWMHYGELHREKYPAVIGQTKSKNIYFEMWYLNNKLSLQPNFYNFMYKDSKTQILFPLLKNIPTLSQYIPISLILSNIETKNFFEKNVPERANKYNYILLDENYKITYLWESLNPL